MMSAAKPGVGFAVGAMLPSQLPPMVQFGFGVGPVAAPPDQMKGFVGTTAATAAARGCGPGCSAAPVSAAGRPAGRLSTPADAGAPAAATRLARAGAVRPCRPARARVDAPRTGAPWAGAGASPASRPFGAVRPAGGAAGATGATATPRPPAKGASQERATGASGAGVLQPTAAGRAGVSSAAGAAMASNAAGGRRRSGAFVGAPTRRRWTIRAGSASPSRTAARRKRETGAPRPTASRAATSTRWVRRPWPRVERGTRWEKRTRRRIVVGGMTLEGVPRLGEKPLNVRAIGILPGGQAFSRPG